MTTQIQYLEETDVDTVGPTSISRPIGKVIVVDDEPGVEDHSGPIAY